MAAQNSDQGSILCPLQWKHKVLTTGQPGKSPIQYMLKIKWYCTADPTSALCTLNFYSPEVTLSFIMLLWDLSPYFLIASLYYSFSILQFGLLFCFLIQEISYVFILQCPLVNTCIISSSSIMPQYINSYVILLR